MLKNKKNLYILLIAIFVQLIAVLMSYFNLVPNIDVIMIVIAAATAVILLCTNCLQHCGKSILLCILSFMFILGIGKLGIMTEYTITYAGAIIKNNVTVEKIINSDTHHRIMSYGQKDYYVDNGYTYLYEIEKVPMGYNVVANNILIREDIEKTLDLYVCEFYSLETINSFSNMTEDKVSISFVNGMQDAGVVVKIISSENKVFYSYLEIEDTHDFVNSLGIADLLFTVGKTNFYITKPSKIINGTVSDDEVDFVDGEQYLITEDGELSASHVVYIEFEEDSSYYNRINYYIYRDYFAKLEEYERALETMMPDSEEYKEMLKQIESLKVAMPSYTCELAYEQLNGKSIIRMYKTFIMDGELEEVPNISIIEIYKDGKYIYARTDLEIEDLY